jgi:hypothetical protein
MPDGNCSGRLLRRALLGVTLAISLAEAQTATIPSAKKASTHRANELTLAGLRPGKDGLERARQLYRLPNYRNEKRDSQVVWLSNCGKEMLTVDYDSGNKIQVIRDTETDSTPGKCVPPPPGAWKTGLGLHVGDQTARVMQLYGSPDSKSPSTRDGQPLELWYYAFDWAGENVPQVMEVLCTREADGKAGRVVEITLAAPSL